MTGETVKKNSLKHIKLFEYWRPEWSWPEEARLIELGLHEPDLFQCWTRIPHEPSERLDKREVQERLERIAAEFGVQCQGGRNAGRSAEERFEFLWVGPVQGLKDFVEAARREFLPWDRIVVRNWVRVTERWQTLEDQEWWSWFKKSRGIVESVDPAEQLSRLADLGLLNLDEIEVKDFVVNLLERHYPELKFNWWSRGELRLKASLPDDTKPSYFTRAASNSSRWSLAGDWLWRGPNREMLMINTVTDSLAKDKDLQLALLIYRKSLPFLDAVYRDKKTGRDETH